MHIKLHANTTLNFHILAVNFNYIQRIYICKHQLLFSQICVQYFVPHRHLFYCNEHLAHFAPPLP